MIIRLPESEILLAIVVGIQCVIVIAQCIIIVAYCRVMSKLARKFDTASNGGSQNYSPEIKEVHDFNRDEYIEAWEGDPMERRIETKRSR